MARDQSRDEERDRAIRVREFCDDHGIDPCAIVAEAIYSGALDDEQIDVADIAGMSTEAATELVDAVLGGE